MRKVFRAFVQLNLIPLLYPMGLYHQQDFKHSQLLRQEELSLGLPDRSLKDLI